MTASSEISVAFVALEAACAAGKLSAAARDNIRKWLSETGYRAYADRIVSLVSAGEFDRLEALFWETIPFGTGGRRGTMAEFGSATINDRTIAESANGLALYLRRVRGSSGGRIALAYDTRHRSRDFARIAATTWAAQGLQVFLFDAPRSTPELSFAVRHLQCDAGAMISASHNPPTDNGFKAYWSNGAQVLPPHDQGIIRCVYESNEIPTVDYDAALKSGQITLIGESVDAAYVQQVLALGLSSVRTLSVTFTPLHGVGETSVYRVLHQAGFSGVELFEPQRKQNGAFPNVPRHLPNPELPAVFDPAIAAAQGRPVELILASDPDADRLGAAVRNHQGEFVQLTGNRIGVLLVDYILGKRRGAGTLTPRNYVVETLVTTPLVARIAAKYGVRAIDNLLVGFKYIGQTMDREGPEHFVFGAEESLGYLAGQYARDKDAAVAALYLCEYAAELKQQGRTLLDRLDEIFIEHGYYLESQRSESCPGPTGRAKIEKLMRRFAEQPPQELGGISLVRVRDYIGHAIRELPANRQVAELPEPRGDMLIFEGTGRGSSMALAARPSGTEPKIKFYFFARADVPAPADLPAVAAQAGNTLQEFGDALSAWVQQVFAE